MGRVQSDRLLKTWIVLPTYNEAGNVTAMLDAILSLGSGMEILVVDDDSPDGTGVLVEARAQQEPRVRALRRRGERGLGTAYQAGFQEALRRGAQAVVTMDCDFSHDPAQIPALVAALDGADVAVGSRYTPGGRIEGWSLHRRLLSASANRFVHLLFHLPAHDCTSGFRAYRRHILEAIPWERIQSTGYSFLVESLLWAARQEVARIREVPICFKDRDEGVSKLGWREAVHGAFNLLRVWRRQR